MRCKRAIPRSMHARASRARSAYACRLCENRPGGRHSAARTPCVLVNVPACMRCAASCLATAFVLFFGTCASFEHGRVGHVADAICMPCCMHRCDRFHSVNRQKHEHTNACVHTYVHACMHACMFAHRAFPLQAHIVVLSECAFRAVCSIAAPILDALQDGVDALDEVSHYRTYNLPLFPYSLSQPQVPGSSWICDWDVSPK